MAPSSRQRSPLSASGFRYAFDDPGHLGIELVERRGGRRLRQRALSHCVQVSDQVLPRIQRIVTAASQQLHIQQPVTAFVYPSADINAHCSSDFSQGGSVLLFIASTFVTLLNDRELMFVVGHELGHALFGHDQYPAPQEDETHLRRLELWRAAEISADRTGLIACGDLEVAARAMLKSASGLAEEHLELDLAAYIRQVSALREASGDETILCSTHPPFPLRTRALLRFDSILKQAESGSDVRDALLQADTEIDREIQAAACGADEDSFTEVAQRAAFWHVARNLCREGALARAHQDALAGSFGRERVDALRHLLQDSARSDALRFLDEKTLAARAELERAPLFAARRFNELIHAFSLHDPVSPRS